jgi:hypothetical protein
MSICYIARLVDAENGTAPTARMFDTPEQAAQQVERWIRRGAKRCSIMTIAAPDAGTEAN